jgi:subtilase family serine protease
MDHMLLALQRPAEREQTLRQLIDRQHDPKSPDFHKWLTPAELGQAYGPAQQDIDAVTSWLQSQGFVVNGVYPSGMLIDFSGSAGQVRTAFHAAIHHLNVNGSSHLANMSDPQIPAALAPVVSGIVSLHDFSPRPMRKAHASFTFDYSSSRYHAVTPEDLATIYNLNPLFQQGNTGQGQTIAVVEDAVLYDPADWDTFRSTFGLSAYASGSLTQVQPAPPAGGTNCAVPGLAAGDDGEAILDSEWASAAAPGAAILVASCANTRTTFGGLIALQNLINGANPPSIVSISYGDCEAANGATLNAAFTQVFQQAAAQGVSVFVSSGDEGAAGCDSGATGATHGIGVSGFASTPYNVAVGGTDFADSYTSKSSTYWNATNTANYGSALSYIPEIPWNDSCAGSLLVSFLGFTSPYGSGGLCGSTKARQDGLLSVSAGSGGPSGCATGAPFFAGVVGGTCQGQPKPAWQSGVPGIPADGVRDLPDVSLFAGTGIWGHYYVICWSDLRNGGAPCTGDPSNWAGAGGTSFSAPVLAGIQALVNQKVGGPQGNPNYTYYQLAASGTASCDTAAADTSACVFHNISQGDISVNCGGARDCFGATIPSIFTGRRSASADGALSVPGPSYVPAFGAASGWNFATGLGSVDAYNLVTRWAAWLSGK